LIFVEAIYRNFDFLCYSLQIKWEIPKLRDIIKESKDKFKGYYDLYEHDLEILMTKFKPIVPKIIKRLKDVFKHEYSYWLYTNNTIYNFLNNLDDYEDYAC